MKHFLSLDELTSADFHGLLALAGYLKDRRRKNIPDHCMTGKTLVMIFEKPSLRTRLSFEVAMVDFGGHGIYLRGEEIGLGEREPVQDAARVLSRYHHGIMARVFKHATVAGLAQHASIPVVNGLSDASHPCQALADFQTIHEHFGSVAGKRIANNVSRSLAHACILAGSTLVLACPKDYAFTAEDIAAFGASWGTSVIQLHDPAQAVANADILYSDVWTSMGQEAEKAIRLKAFQGYQINEKLLSMAPKAKVMHCLPAHRGEEITDGAMESAQSIVFDQAENRLHAQKAVLRVLMSADGPALLASMRPKA